MSKIVKLEAENVKRLRAVCIKPNGKPVVVIGGRNGQGKTSVLDSIEYALGGKPNVGQPIRKGTDKARVVVETDDLVVTRIFTAGGSRLEVLGKSGELRHVIKSPQALLDKLVGKLSFDPLAFSRMETKDQVETLRRLVGINFSGLDAERKVVYEDRTQLNRETKALDSQLAAMVSHPDAPEEEISVSDLTDEYERRLDINRMNAEERKKLVDYEVAEEEAKSAITKTEAMLLELRNLLELQKDKHAEAVKKSCVFRDYVKRLRDEDPDEVRDPSTGASAKVWEICPTQSRLF